MRLLINFYSSILIFIFTSSVLIGENDGIGFLSVQNKNHMNIYLDNIFIANDSFKNMSLKPGIYSIRAEFPVRFKWISSHFKQTIKILADSCINIQVNKENLIDLISHPFGGNLFLDNTYIGKTPLLLQKENYINKTLLLKKKGYKDQLLTINEKQNNYNIILHPNNQLLKSNILKEKNKEKYLQWNREGLILCTIITSWSAFLLKREADHYYDKYQKTSNSHLLEKYYNKTQNFDKYAEISFGVSVISLGTYFYLLIK